ncbi:glycoside hydrolase family 43 protein [Paenibacillus segetis]|uniref:Glycosyl hydrolase family 43 n=1 Tax=Paenibacillus segetis TaxID=1325360 RepID=A0ABQ1YKZ7_9BACL|nr:glycoside hydrolase family 43 protein [Paenibacillus segetis]GGH28787.1 glycosyl hydrolase family 43 [Paenibacillus segetis]
MQTTEIQLRDPFILRVDDEQLYYLYGTTDANPWTGKGQGFQTYRSHDLNEWEGPFTVFTPPLGFWADQQFWAPEVHPYQGAYYMLASFKADNRSRGVHILRAETPLGPFIPISEEPITPLEWDCLDGTLYIDEDQIPWFVFSHEWTQISDGAMCCMPLTMDLREATAPPQIMFYASQSGWSVPNTGDVVIQSGENYVTDGPWLHRTQNGTLVMLWSSYSTTGYTIGLARSESGTIQGPWLHDPQPLFAQDGGHGMLFYTWQNELMLTIHQPNTTMYERPCFFLIEDLGDTLVLKHRV